MSYNTKIRRNKWLHIRLTTGEYDLVTTAMRCSTDSQLSNYARKLVLGKPIRISTRDASLDQFIAEMSALKRELSAIGNNFNQVVHRLNAAKEFTEARLWIPVASTHQKKLLEKIDSVSDTLNTLAKKWYPESRQVKASVGR